MEVTSQWDLTKAWTPSSGVSWRVCSPTTLPVPAAVGTRDRIDLRGFQGQGASRGGGAQACAGEVCGFPQRRAGGSPGTGVVAARVTTGCWGFFQNRGGDAESRVCHCFAPLLGPPGAKAKAKANASGLAAGPGVALSTSLGPWHRTRRWPLSSRRGTAQPAAMARRRLRAFPAHAFLALLLPPAVTLGKEQCARAEPREGAQAQSRTAPGVPRPWVRPGGSPGRNSVSAGTRGEGTRRPAGGTGEASRAKGPLSAPPTAPALLAPRSSTERS